MVEYEKITVEVVVQSSLQKVWECFTSPGHIIHWNQASDDWWTPEASCDLKEGGAFSWRMEARDGSFGFDFMGTYDLVEKPVHIRTLLGDGRKVDIRLVEEGNGVRVTEIFEAEQTNPVDMQRGGWQAILGNFKKYVELLNHKIKLHFEFPISARPDKLFQCMFDEKLWKEWTSAFNPDSYYEGSWEKGAKILFLGKSSDGKVGGMVSRVRHFIPGRFVSIEHLGEYLDGKEVYSDNDPEAWAGSMENYSFIHTGEHTILRIDMDSKKEFAAYFEQTWPKAIEKLTQLVQLTH